MSVCHCLACQKRTGSAFAVQARWPKANVELSGEFREWTRTTDSGSLAIYHFCPHCGATVAFFGAGMPDVTAIPVGAFADPSFPPPRFSVYEERKHAWVAILGDDIEHMD